MIVNCHTIRDDLKKTLFIQTHAEWQYVFLITASVYMCGAIAYGLMASGERQDWSRIEGEDAG